MHHFSDVYYGVLIVWKCRIADLKESDLKVFVLIPALLKRDKIHLVIVDFDTGLCGGAKLNEKRSF